MWSERTGKVGEMTKKPFEYSGRVVDAGLFICFKVNCILISVL